MDVKPPVRRHLDGPVQPPRDTNPIVRPVQAPEAAQPPVFRYESVAQKPKPRLWRVVARRAGIAAGVVVSLIVVFLGVKVLLATHKIIARNNDGGAPALAGNIDPSKLKGEGDGRINILLLGVGGPGHAGPYLSDTMMLASIDPKTNQLALLSIPRDLWVPIPGHGWAKINAADSYGETYPGGGGELAKETVSKLLDLPIHYYVRVDFTAFRQAVNSVGGVDVNVPKAIDDPYFPCDNEDNNYCPFYISAGLHHMDGTTALHYARSRETTSDFDRAARQQLIITAIREKALSLQTLTNPLKISGLIDSVGNHVKTDLQPADITKLASIIQNLDPTKTETKVLDTSPGGLLVSGNVGGGYVELPKAGFGNFEQLREFVHSYFTDDYLKQENASIIVENGSGVSGMATQVEQMLKGYGYNVIGAATAATQSRQTVIYDYTNGADPYTDNYLENRFGVKIRQATPKPGDPDIRIIVGSDYQPPK